MALEHDKIKGWFDTDYSHNTATREMASDDLVFYHVTQWDDNALTESQLQYRGQFDVLRKAGRHILSGLRANPVQIDFEPVDESRQDGADLIDGLYRSDDRSNSSQESYDMASQESVVCGYGAWRLTTEYVSMRSVLAAQASHLPDPMAMGFRSRLLSVEVCKGSYFLLPTLHTSAGSPESAQVNR